MKNIFLTGGKGFIGKHFMERYESSFYIDAPSRQQLELTDVKAVEAYFSQKKFDYIIHGANVGGTRKNQLPSLTCLNENIRAFSSVYRNRETVKRFIQLGSGAEYTRPLPLSKIEESYLEKNVPADEYGFSKLICSQLVKAEPPEKTVVLHLFGVFGPYEDYQARFISNAIVRTLHDLPIIINQDVKFDYLYVKDCVRIMHAFIDQIPLFSHYNLGTGEPIQLSEIAEVVKKVLGTHNKIVIKNSGLGHEYTCNNDRLKEFLGKNFRFTPLEEAVREMAAWINKSTLQIHRNINQHRSWTPR